MARKKKVEQVSNNDKVGFFKSPEELIDYVLNGGKAYVNDEDYIYYDNERDCLVHYSLQFEGCEAYQTKDYFIAWANFLKGLTEDGYLPYWHR